MLHVRSVFRLFCREGAPILRHFFQAYFFSGRVNVKQLKYQKRLYTGARGHAAPENFENLHTVMAILVLFEHFLGKVRYIFGL